MWIDHILFIQSSVDRCLGSFQLSVIINKATVNIHVQISVWSTSFHFFGTNFLVNQYVLLICCY